MSVFQIVAADSGASDENESSMRGLLRNTLINAQDMGKWHVFVELIFHFIGMARGEAGCVEEGGGLAEHEDEGR